MEKNHIRPDTGEGRQTRNMSAKAVSQPSQASIEQRQRNIQQDLWTVLYFSVHQKMTETYKSKYTWTIVVLTSCNESIFSMWIMERKKMVIQGNVIGVASNVTDCTQTAHYISPSLLLCLLPLIWNFFVKFANQESLIVPSADQCNEFQHYWMMEKNKMHCSLTHAVG